MSRSAASAAAGLVRAAFNTGAWRSNASPLAAVGQSVRGFATPSPKEDPRVVVVFGASGGIGSALVDTLKEQSPSAKLVLAAQDGGPLKDLAAKVKDAEVHTVDATKPEQVDKLLQEVVSKHKRVDAVASLIGNVTMNPAGATGTSTAGMISDLKKALDTNLLTAAAVLEASARAMSKTGGGSVVLTSAAVAQTGVPGFEVMSAAKAGVEGLVRSAAATYARQGVRVNAVAPGLTRTGQTQELTQGNSKPANTSASMHPVKHFAEPQDIAQALAFFIHPRTDFITGQVLAVDGGLSTLTQQRQ